MKETCRQAFEAGCQTRREHPMREGVFKLKESRSTLHCLHRELQAMAAYKLRKDKRYEGQMCQPDEFPKWLRGLPISIAFDLGRTLRPAFSALEGDGVPSLEVSVMERKAEKRINEIVAKLDRAQLTLDDPITDEYSRMRCGFPTLVPEIQEALSLIEEALDHCRPWVNA